MPGFCLCVRVDVETTIPVPSGSSITFPGCPAMTIGGSDNSQVTIPAGGLFSFPAGERVRVILPSGGQPPFDISASQTGLSVLAPGRPPHMIPYPTAMMPLVELLPELGPDFVKFPSGTVFHFPDQPDHRPFELPQPAGVVIRASTFDFRHLPREDFE
jgi:hypothetical protein